jgi:hypothetical protein
MNLPDPVNVVNVNALRAVRQPAPLCFQQHNQYAAQVHGQHRQQGDHRTEGR